MEIHGKGIYLIELCNEIFPLKIKPYADKVFMPYADKVFMLDKKVRKNNNE